MPVLSLSKGTQRYTQMKNVPLPLSRGGWEELISTTPNPKEGDFPVAARQCHPEPVEGRQVVILSVAKNLCLRL